MKSEIEPLKIISLEAQGMKRIKAVYFKFSKNGLTIIGGKNKNGKSSVLDALGFGLGGDKKRPSDLKNRSLEDGSNPFLRIELSNGIVVERKGKNSSLVVTDETGKKSGQTLLNSFISEFALDIESFLNADEPKRRSLILKALGSEDGLLKLTEKEKGMEIDRTLKGREIKKAEGVFENLVYYEDAPKEKLSREAIAKEYSEATKENANIENEKRKLELFKIDLEREEELSRQDAELVANLKAELKLAEKTEAERLAKIAGYKEASNEKEFELSLMAIKEIEPILKNLKEIDSENKKFESNEEREKARKNLRKLQEEYSKLNSDILAVREEKKTVVNAAEANLLGLDWDGEELVFNGQRWDCMSGAEQMIVSTSISRILSPNCGFVLIDKLEQLDPETLSEFGDWLNKEKLQAIGTRVSTGDECSFILEDGEIKE